MIRGDISVIASSVQVCDSVGIHPYSTTDVDGLQVCFAGWIRSRDCSNWCNHMQDYFGDKFVYDMFPIELFIGKHEGDIVKINIHAKPVQIRCTGSFEHTLYKMTSSFGGVCPANCYDPELSEDEQKQMITLAHTMYATSLGMDVVPVENFRHNDTINSLC